MGKTDLQFLHFKKPSFISDDFEKTSTSNLEQHFTQRMYSILNSFKDNNLI